jgi:hypothetical protein
VEWWEVVRPLAKALPAMSMSDSRRICSVRMAGWKSIISECRKQGRCSLVASAFGGVLRCGGSRTDAAKLTFLGRLMLFIGPIRKNHSTRFFCAVPNATAFLGFRQKVAVLISDLELVVTEKQTDFDVIQIDGVISV